MGKQDHSIMHLLPDELQRALRAQGTEVRFPEGQVIFWEGQPSHSVLVIEEGHVKVTQRASDGAEVILAIRGPGEVMGDEGVLMEEPRSATVTTITDVVGVDIAADDLLRFVEEQKLWPEMYKAAVRRRRQSDQQVLLARLGVRNRLARWLLELANEIGEQTDDGWVLAVSMSQQDLASRIGASRDAVAIELRKLREQKLVTTGRRQITLHDLEALRRFAL
ncbi:Crp/Fnr family transcriptional regulator [Streptomyces olivochromogenes]|uniref:Crp/Fnr family transcriptional regulator n=1 Tax=Streptomyces olivochromogenes TaxID=1963 RepID=UPI001F3D6775|nr:Crp/Fnr family transcriptional regulator [Streptomyces olivochromogenes]MCF3136113.1 Crp/Fnr family transcriptional regulator [Streptomyces olivochromogenes]